MAFEMEHDLPSGFTVAYWRVNGEVRIDYDNKDIHYVLYGYKSKKLRDAAPDTPGTTRDIRMSGAEFEKNFPKDAPVNLVTQLYNAAKVVEADPMFRDAADA